jgi:uncharacterized protein YkwD
MLVASLRQVTPFLLGFGLIVSCATSQLSALEGVPPACARDKAESCRVERDVFRRINDVRERYHLKPLRGRTDLARVALAHANDMARNDYRSHVDLQGRNPLDRVQGAGVDGFALLAENIGASNVSGSRIESVVEHWLRSTSHRENLLNPAFNSTGVGVAEAPDGTTIYVQLFATFTDTP